METKPDEYIALLMWRQLGYRRCQNGVPPPGDRPTGHPMTANVAASIVGQIATSAEMARIRVDTHGLAASKYAAMPRFVFKGKLLRDL
jgi:hypothetical protein